MRGVSDGLPHRADMVKWYHRRFPTFCRGFNSRYPHLSTGQLCRTTAPLRHRGCGIRLFYPPQMVKPCGPRNTVIGPRSSTIRSRMEPHFQKISCGAWQLHRTKSKVETRTTGLRLNHVPRASNSVERLATIGIEGRKTLD